MRPSMGIQESRPNEGPHAQLHCLIFYSQARYYRREHISLFEGALRRSFLVPGILQPFILHHTSHLLHQLARRGVVASAVSRWGLVARTSTCVSFVQH